jgi:hypothetical protein
LWWKSKGIIKVVVKLLVTELLIKSAIIKLNVQFSRVFSSLVIDH